MDLDELARGATRELLNVTSAGVAQRRTLLDQTRRRRRIGNAAALTALVTLMAGGLLLVTAPPDDRDTRPARPIGEGHGTALVTVNTAGQIHALDGDVAVGVPREVHALSPIDFTSDGTRVMFQAQDGSLRLVDLRTGGSRSLGACAERWCDADLSADGRFVAVGSGGLDSVIEIRPVGEGRIQRLPIAGAAHAPSWSPDGEHLTFTADEGLFLIGKDGRGMRLLWPASGELATGSWSSELMSMTEPASWSPDGSRIAFLATEPWDDDVSAADPIIPVRYTLKVLDLGSGATELSRYVGGCYCLNVSPPAVAWSPDGSLIAVNVVDNGRRDTKGAARNAGVHVVRPDGTGWRQLTTESATWGLAWQPSMG